MAYTSLSLFLYSSDLDTGLLDMAVSLARRWQARIEVNCLGIQHSGYEAVPLGATATIVDAGLEDARLTAHEIAERAEAHLSRADVDHAVRTKVAHTSSLVATLAGLARYSDLVLLRPPHGSGSCDLDVVAFEAGLFGTSAPVMILPDMLTDLPNLRRVVVGWNDSPEALNAVRAAMPILKQAEEVDILVVDPPTSSPERSDPGGSLCAMLLRNGVKANVSVVSRKLQRISDVLRGHARQHGAGLILMGGYGHSRLREAVFGGVTRDMLGDGEFAVMMAR